MTKPVLSEKSVVSTAFSVDGAWICYRPVNSQARYDLARNLQNDLRPTHNCRLTTDHKATRCVVVKSPTSDGNSLLLLSFIIYSHSRHSKENAAILGLV